MTLGQRSAKKDISPSKICFQKSELLGFRVAAGRAAASSQLRKARAVSGRLLAEQEHYRIITKELLESIPPISTARKGGAA